MKNKQPDTKVKNRKILTYYIILAVCLVLIAAITVSVIFAVKNNKSAYVDTTIDAGDSTDSGADGSSADGSSADEGGTEDEGKDTSTATVFVLPIADNAVMTNSYTLYYNVTLDKYYRHSGIDFSADVGTEVYTAIDGVVESITTSSVLKGTTITIAHSGDIKTVYSYVDAAEGLAVGDEVARGQVIATVAEAVGDEYKEGSHLHFEVYLNGASVNPEDYLDIESK